MAAAAAARAARLVGSATEPAAAAARAARLLGSATGPASARSLTARTEATVPKIPTWLKNQRLFCSKAQVAEELAKLVKEPLSETGTSKAKIPTWLKNQRWFCSRTSDMAKVAEELAKLVKEPPSEAVTSKAKALLEQLNGFYHYQEQTLSFTKSLEGRVLYLEMVRKHSARNYALVNSALVCAVIVIPSLVYKVEFSVKNLRQETHDRVENIEKRLEATEAALAASRTSALAASRAQESTGESALETGESALATGEAAALETGWLTWVASKMGLK